MDDLNKLSESLEEWQGNPMTVRLKGLVGKVLAAERDEMCQAWLAGNPPPEASRLALLGVMQIWDNFFEATAEGIEDQEQEIAG